MNRILRFRTSLRERIIFPFENTPVQVWTLVLEWKANVLPCIFYFWFYKTA
jgi:hypothetical protein